MFFSPYMCPIIAERLHGQLSNLQALVLNGNQLTALPESIGQLSNLQSLVLIENQLTALPESIGQLSNLRSLFISDNQLTALPESIGQLTNLQVIDLRRNELTTLPESFGLLANLQRLILWDNQLTSLPPEIGQLTNLRQLDLRNNQLTSLPQEVGQLSNLEVLILEHNQLTSLPPEIGQLTDVVFSGLELNQLKSPPPEIVAQGTKAVLSFLREQLESQTRQWVSKLLFVGEGGVGKTSLLRTLRGEQFNPGESSTYGIDISTVELEHPEIDNVTMRLNSWDFGGQDIYHATHQFFLTERSLMLLTWDARMGWEAGKLYYWLRTINSRAPEARVIIVATHIDQREASIPINQIMREFPQAVEYCAVSNKTGEGEEELREKVRSVAAKLPLMGEPWPTTWVHARNAISDAKPRRYMLADELDELILNQGVESGSVMC